MDLPTDRPPPTARVFGRHAPGTAKPDLGLDRAREINSRRAEIENPELLRRLRAL